MTKVFRTFLTLVLFAAPMVAALAQPPIGGNPPCWPPPCIPVDGGLGALMVAGVLFGVKKALELRKDRKSND